MGAACRTLLYGAGRPGPGATGLRALPPRLARGPGSARPPLAPRSALRLLQPGATAGGAAPFSLGRRWAWAPAFIPSPHFLCAGAGAGLVPFTAAADQRSRSVPELHGEQPEEMPAAALLAADSEPESALEGEVARAGRRRKHKDKKEKKSKRRNKSKELKSQTEENGLSEDDLEPPKPKKKKKVKEKVNLEIEENSPESMVKSSSMSNGIVCSKAQSNSSEASSAEYDSDQEPVKQLTEEEKEGAFSNFSISKETTELLKARGVKYLFSVQAKTFQPIYDGKDVIAQARTGTGKTFSFAIPLIEKLQGDTLERKRGRTPKVLVLAPTRELAIQVARDFKDVTKKLTVACFYGGTPYRGQIEHIKNGIDILVGTPGRIKDLLQHGKLDFSNVKHVVLDEVDQILDMGFAEQVEEILAFAYKKDSEDNPQTLLFSATCPHWVYDVAKKYMKSKYEQIDLIGKKTQKTAVTVEHLAIKCHWSQRAAVIKDVIQVYSGSHGRTIIFCETKRDANELALNASIKQDAQSLHGDIPQKQREITLKGFRNGTFEVLVATNVAARGLDIPEVDLVIQSSPPKDVDSYIHRSGRTGRAGRTGICICFYQQKEENQLRLVEQKAGITFKCVGVPTATDIIKASSKDAVRSLDSVSPSAIDYFKQLAKRLIEEKGAVEALAAALARISGATSIEQRSLLNSDAGYVTMTLQCSVEMHNMGYAWRALKEQLGDEIDNTIPRMHFLKGKMGVCFDVPAAELSRIQEQWQDSRRWQLSIATEFPELEKTPREAGRGFSNFRNERRGGDLNKSNRFKNGGQKRSFHRAF
ncbi:nucleolar RNA helicase 2-like [Gopherus flavomarginatus]|uniref:nucleolar RNA helicase 2-like n=1 Tax=Gopherus flavomarginatus TaxID=286002 RepID=UPI0021CC3A08|nr:nucleolar RNA helicase 2-like [Gopherus flavomarginatus]